MASKSDKVFSVNNERYDDYDDSYENDGIINQQPSCDFVTSFPVLGSRFLQTARSFGLVSVTSDVYTLLTVAKDRINKMTVITAFLDLRRTLCLSIMASN